MKTLFITLFFFLSASLTQAAFLHEPANVSDIPELESIAGETIYGKLIDFPHTFTFVVSEKQHFSAQVSIDNVQAHQDVSLILVKQEKRGVSEVGRLNGQNVTWTKLYDLWRAVTFMQGEVFSYTLKPGIYTLEISSPENNRGYRLVLGKGNNEVFKELSFTRSVFAVHPLSIFLSPLLVIPLLLLILYIAWHFLRSYKNTHA